MNTIKTKFPIKYLLVMKRVYSLIICKCPYEHSDETILTPKTHFTEKDYNNIYVNWLWKPNKNSFIIFCPNVYLRAQFSNEFG